MNPTVDDNPDLDRDNEDGAGPEILNLRLPENGITYRVGVHYWFDHGFGPSTATVRIYVYSSLVFEASALLVNLDMWEVATVEWPSGKTTKITKLDGAQKIIPNYNSPFFPH